MKDKRAKFEEEMAEVAPPPWAEDNAAGLAKKPTPLAKPFLTKPAPLSLTSGVRTTFSPLTEGGISRLSSQDVLNRWQEILTRTGVPAYPTGIEILDDLIWGTHKREILIIGGRPGQGKTSLVVQMAIEMAKRGKIYLYSLEMAKEQIVERLIAHLGKIDNQILRRGSLELAKQTQRIQVIAHDCKKLNLWMVDNRGHSIKDYFKDIEAGRPDFIVIDYIQLMSKLDFHRTHESIGQVLALFKALSKKFDCGIIICSQLNREGELKASGSLEEVADTIIELDWRGQDSDEPSDRGEYYLNVSKQRHGPMGVLRVWYDPTTYRFSEA